ncbi:hypothetical protein [Natrinema versiforme]|uniref:hypothetical protein n=1 Tax=Natrinema versiforme TaxID=88724 RepID=UPI001EF9FCDD|nr:hypothetical protein [Natrinema versiforme]
MNTAAGRALVIALVVVSMAGTSGAVLTDPAVAADGDDIQRVVIQQSTADEEQNETPSHRNPDSYSEGGNIEGVENWLTDQLTSQLGDGAIQLSEGEYELANEYVGEEYRDRLSQYADVAGQTEGESLEEDFEEAGENQSRLSEAVADYRETKEEYEAAREAGNEERARELARELETLANEIETLGGSVRESYDEIEAATGANLSESDAAVEEVNNDIQTEQETVREQQFEETELTLEPERTDISFTEPLIAAGELRTADGNPIANEEIQLAIGNHSERVATDSAGRFTLEYRPANESLSTDELEVQYVPETQSTYLGDETTVNVSIEQSEPAVSLNEASNEVSYGEEATVVGEVTVDGVPVDGVTLAVVLEGERIGTAEVQNGIFGTSATIPASVENGDQDLRVRLPFEEQALAAAADATTVTVRETESALSVEATSVGERELMVNGTLATAGGDGVASQTVQFRIDGMTVSSVTTEDGGTFGDTVTVPESVDEGEVTVSATYDGRGSNLEPATVETVITIGETGPLSTAVWVAGGFIVVIAAGLLVWWFRRSGDDKAVPVGPADDQGTAVSGGTVADQSSSTPPDTVEPLLEQASEQLSNGQPNNAARTGYAAVRRALSSQIDEQGSLTHWEFYRNYPSDDGTETELLYEITSEYERAAFDRGDVSTDEAAGTLETARQLCSPDDLDDRYTHADD